MKLNRVGSYLSQTDITWFLIQYKFLKLLGRKGEAQFKLMELFEQLETNPSVNSSAVARRRKRLLGDAAKLLSDHFIAQSQTENGVAFFRRILLKNPDSESPYEGLQRLILPGDHYVRILEAIHKHLKPKFYVEIGVADGNSLYRALPTTYAVGIDPNPCIKRALRQNIVVFSETSDQFFAAYGERPELADRKIDLAFIDGLHHFEQVLRDFINVEKHTHNNGLILLHDCIPLDEVSTSRDRKTRAWMGDTWKTLAILLDHRQDLDIKVVRAPPSGLVLIRALSPRSQKLAENFSSLVDAYLPLGFADWEQLYASRIRIIPSDAADIPKYLPDPQASFVDRA